MSVKKEYKSIDVKNILNYAENPRHEIGISEIDTLKKLIEKAGSQYMFNLAKDIYQKGLISSNLPVVVFNPDEKKYVVYEGNRRIACLKFLKTPSILATIDKSLKSRIENLKAKESSAVSYKIYCYITDEEEAYFIMERTHSGEDQGRGTKAWSSKEKGVFQKRQKQKNTIALTIAELTEKFLNEDVTKKLPYTTIQRFFNNKEVKKALGVENDTNRGLTKEKILLINLLIEKTIEESHNTGIALTRLLNKANEIESFFLPLIAEHAATSEISSVSEPTEDSLEENAEKTTKDNGETTESTDEQWLEIKLKNDESEGYFTNQTIDLREKVAVTNKAKFNSELLEIDHATLNVVDGIVQPNNLPGQYSITYTYYMDDTKEKVFWQDILTINIKLKNTTIVIEQPQTVLSKTFAEKYIDQLVFEHSEKIRSLISFLATENKNGNYSSFINIVSRMFLEYTFRLYASKVLKDDNQAIEDRSSSLKSLIEYCCNKIEQSNQRVFVKHVRLARKEAANKVDILQKSVHYFDVTMSNDEIQVMFKNLVLYLEHIYDELLIETLSKGN